MEPRTGRAIQRAAGWCGLAAVLLLPGCSSTPAHPDQSDARLRQQTAQATEKAKVEAREAARDAREAARVAERKLDAVAQGVKEGIAKPAPGRMEHPVDINTASREQLESLPGIGDETAQSILRHRPYRTRRDLVSKGVISSTEYDRIASEITVD